MESKICKICAADKPLSEYYKNRNSVLNYCKSCHNQKTKKYYQENREERREYFAGWRSRNKEKAKLASRRWQRNNRDKVNESSRRRDALKKKLTVEKVDYSWIRNQSTYCYLCGQTLTEERFDTKRTEIDHIIPLSRTELNPSHSYENLALVHSFCNGQKGSKTPEEYFEFVGYTPLSPSALGLFVECGRAPTSADFLGLPNHKGPINEKS